MSAQNRIPRQIAVWALAFLGLWLTGSKAGLLAGVAVVIAAVALGAVRIAPLALSISLAVAAVLLINWLPDLVFALTQAAKDAARSVTAWFCEGCVAPETAAVFGKRSFSSVAVVASGFESSSAERVVSLQAGWRMFLDHPVFGAGLGAFLEAHARTTGAPLVIHSTPLWLMAEMGIIGLLVFAAPFLRILTRELAPARHHVVPSVFLVLALVGFGTMALVHELLYQRAVWLLAGAALAVPFAKREG